MITWHARVYNLRKCSPTTAYRIKLGKSGTRRSPAIAAGRIWAADARDPHAYLSWRGGDNRWRHIGDDVPASAELVTPTVENGYLLLSHAAGAQ